LTEKEEELKKSIEENLENKDYNFLRGDYFYMSTIFKKQNKQIERLRYLFLTLYIDFSGMGNQNYVDRYEKIKRVFKINIWQEIDFVRKKLNINDDTILKIFDETIAKYAVPLPFTYFDVETIRKIISDKLNEEEEEDLFKKYDPLHVNPDLRSANYKVELKKGHALDTLPENYVLLDVETTGLNPKVDNIIEVGCIKIKNGKEFGRYKSIIKTPIELSGKIKKMTGLTNEILNKAPEMETIAPRLWAFLKDEVVVGHNINFDIQFLYIAFFETLGKVFDNDYFDTLKLFKTEYPQFKSHSLENICDELNICASHHRAMVDCLIVKEILDRIQKRRNDDEITIIKEDLTAELASKFALKLIKSIDSEDYDSFEPVLKFCDDLIDNDLATAKLCKKCGDIFEKFEDYEAAISFYNAAMDIDPELNYYKKIEKLEKKAYNF